MKTPLTPHILRGQKGMAIIETVPLLVIFVVLISFGLGFFGVVHTAILHSIAARNYSFETFRQRTNLSYFRENLSGARGEAVNFTAKGWRYHAINHESDLRNRFVSTVRPIAIGSGTQTTEAGQEVHNSGIFSLQPRNQKVGLNPVWVMVGYGICLNATCGNP